ncbi:hypothetical protein [Microlunatus antarcticus]|uniref:Uncharacterized protein n=1 Tax=Microlunatus antarcticus TaxID=53388 RepID=A0A7W5JVM7_9ACTN|nr:hypothetical protein [Microlunatus antarcticus]MBB3327192.1 hypothetical protein [Microlunatus antarcticus]
MASRTLSRLSVEVPDGQRFRVWTVLSWRAGVAEESAYIGSHWPRRG